MTLKEFLKENRALVQFRANYRTGYRLKKRLTKKESNEYLKAFSNSVNGLMNAFNWKNTPEGITYWNMLDKEWTAICNKK